MQTSLLTSGHMPYNIPVSATTPTLTPTGLCPRLHMTNAVEQAQAAYDAALSTTRAMSASITAVRAQGAEVTKAVWAAFRAQEKVEFAAHDALQRAKRVAA